MSDGPAAALAAAARERILILDGAMGTQIQGLGLGEDDFTGHGACAVHGHPQQGNNDLLILTQPEAIEEIHYRYAIAGADIVETNTFSSTAIAQADYGMQDRVYDLNLHGARLVRRALDRATAEDGRRALRRRRARADQPHRLDLAGRQRPRLPRRQLRRPARRLCRADRRADRRRRRPDPDRDDLRHAERQGGDLRLRGGLRREGVRLPIMISGTITDLSGRTLSGQTPTAFWHSVRHARPFTVGLNCALGAAAMRAHLGEIAEVADTLTCAYPNAGLPNAFGRLRREPGVHGGADRGVRARRPDQRRRRLLRHHARAHPGDRRGRRQVPAARRPRAAAADAALRARAVHADAGDPLRQRRRAHQRHRLGALPQADHRRRLPRGARGRARPGRERRPDHRRQHGRGPDRLGQGDDRPSSTSSPPSRTSPRCR